MRWTPWCFLGGGGGDEFMMTSSNGNKFRVTGPLCWEFIGHRWISLTKASDTKFDVFFDLLNKRLSKQSSHRWFETPSRSLWRHCNVVPNSDPVIRAATGSFDVQRVTLVQFWIGETGQIGGFRALWKEWPQTWHTDLPWLPFLGINYILHSAAVQVVGVRSSIN